MRLLMLAMRVPDPGKITHSSVRERHGSGHFRDELLHRFPHPERGVRPEGRAQGRVVAACSEQQAGDPLLKELLMLDDVALKAEGDAGDRR
jgi:hypothetical protein